MDNVSVASDTESQTSQSVRRSSRLAAKQQTSHEPEGIDLTTPVKSRRGARTPAKVKEPTSAKNDRTPEKSPSRGRVPTRTPTRSTRAIKVSTPSKEPPIQELSFESSPTPKRKLSPKKNDPQATEDLFEEIQKTPMKLRTPRQSETEMNRKSTTDSPKKETPIRISSRNSATPRQSESEKGGVLKSEKRSISPKKPETSAVQNVSTRKSVTPRQSESDKLEGTPKSPRKSVTPRYSESEKLEGASKSPRKSVTPRHSESEKPKRASKSPRKSVTPRHSESEKLEGASKSPRKSVTPRHSESEKVGTPKFVKRSISPKKPETSAVQNVLTRKSVTPRQSEWEKLEAIPKPKKSSISPKKLEAPTVQLVSPRKSVTSRTSEYEKAETPKSDFPKTPPSVIDLEKVSPRKMVTRRQMDMEEQQIVIGSPRKSDISLRLSPTPAKAEEKRVSPRKSATKRHSESEKRDKSPTSDKLEKRRVSKRKPANPKHRDSMEKETPTRTSPRKSISPRKSESEKLESPQKFPTPRKLAVETPEICVSPKKSTEAQKSAEDELEQKNKAATLVQAFWRGHNERKMYKTMKADVKIQAVQNAESQQVVDKEIDVMPKAPQHVEKKATMKTEPKKTKKENKKALVPKKLEEKVVPPSNWPKIKDAEKLFKKRSTMDTSLLTAIKSSYEFLNQTEVVSNNLSDQLVTSNEEMIWQQVAYQNKLLFKKFKKIKDGFEEKFEGLEDFEEEELIEDEMIFDDEYMGEDEEVSEMDEDLVENEEEEDLFNLRAEDLRDIDEKLDALESDEDEPRKLQEAEPKQPKKLKKSIVDDEFFKLSEMEEFLDAEENKDYTSGLFDEVQDKETGPADYVYADFFAEEKSKKKKNKRKLQEDGAIDKDVKKSKKKKKVHFAVDEDESAPELVGDDEVPENEGERILLGPVEDDKPQTSFQATQEKLKKKISKLEEENLAPKSWDLSGEISGQERDKDTLLDTYLSVDYRAKHAPNISVDTTEKLEAMIVQRIKDKAFDDVERKVRLDETIKPYRNETVDDTTRKSLVDLYEERFQKAKEDNAGKKEEEVDPQVKEIEGQMNDLFKMLDAMSHYMFKPPEVTPEVKIVHNMAALRAEEVGPMASTAADEALLAPEEVSKHLKGELKASDERTQTDRLRERRKKKKKQHDMAKKSEEGESKKPKLDFEEGGRPKKKKFKPKQKDNKDFFTKLQETTVQEIKEKVKKKDKMKNSLEKISGTKYKL